MEKQNRLVTTHNSLFLPAAGFRGYDGILDNVGWSGGCWSNTQCDSDGAYALDFGDIGADWHCFGRNFGFFLRCIADEEYLIHYFIYSTLCLTV